VVLVSFDALAMSSSGDRFEFRPLFFPPFDQSLLSIPDLLRFRFPLGPRANAHDFFLLVQVESEKKGFEQNSVRRKAAFPCLFCLSMTRLACFLPPFCRLSLLRSRQSTLRT